MNGDQHALYRFYSDTGALLYVGITNNPGNRFAQHQERKDWWPEVRGISVEWYDNRDDVLNAERRAIQVENPFYNIRKRGQPSPPRAHSTRLVWICRACRAPVADNTGYIHVNDADLAQVEKLAYAWDQEHGSYSGELRVISCAELSDYPDPVKWEVHHRNCDPRPDSGDYWIGIERARTHAHLLDWTAHLMEKNWLKHTDWGHLIRRMAGVDA